MSEDIRLSKVGILIQQKKYSEAEKILADLLVQDANNVHILTLLAEVNLQQGKFDNALNIIHQCIGLSPHNSHLFFIKSRIAIQQSNLMEAEQYIKEAIDLDPNDADYFALQAVIKLGRKQFEEALSKANHALEIDPENIMALNTRSTALNKLNKTAESFNTIEGALREDPNNAYTHTNYGWGLLEKGNHKKALEHFKMALTNDPSYEYAQAGMLEALKAKNVVYRMFLKYAFWMNNLTAKYQWGVIIGFFVAFRILRTMASLNEELAPFLNPLIILLAVIAFSTWIITPISNLFLRFNKYGQLLLDKKEKTSSNFVALSLAICITGTALYYLLPDERMMVVAGYGFAMMLPLGTMLLPSKNKNGLLIYTICLAVAGLIAIVLTFNTNEIFNSMTNLFIVGFIAFQWVANYMLIKEDNE